MASTIVPIQTSFRRGMVRDFARDQMPAGSVWDMLNFIPLGDTPFKRGGWTYASSILPGSTASTPFVAPFTFETPSSSLGEAALATNASRLFVNTSSGWYHVSSSTSAASTGVSATYSNDPVSFGEYVVFSSTSVSGVQLYTNSATSTFASAMPAWTGIQSLAVYRQSLAAAQRYSKRVYFSKPGSASTWDSTNGFIELPTRVNYLIPLGQVLLAFSTSRVDVIRGAPPPYTGSTATVSPDLRVDQLYQRGTTTRPWVDGTSCYFATADGLYVTDGAGVSDITEATGMKSYWADFIDSVHSSSFPADLNVYLGMHRRTLFTATTSASIPALAYDTVRQAWWRCANLPSYGFATNPDDGSTYCGLATEARVIELSSMWSPAAGNSTSVTGSIETPYFLLGSYGSKRIEDAYVTYDLRDAGSANPTLTVSYTLSQDDDASYVAASTTLPETSATDRRRVPLDAGKEGQGVAFKIAQSGDSASTRIRAIELDYSVREPSRV